MKLIKNVKFSKEETDMIDHVLEMLDDYMKADIDEVYDDVKELAYSAKISLLNFYDSIN